MQNEHAAAIAAHDQHRAEHFASMKEAFMDNPKRFKRRLEKTMQYVTDNGQFADHIRHGPEMMSCRLAIFGFHLLFAEMALWEEELEDAEAESKPKRRRKIRPDDQEKSE